MVYGIAIPKMDEHGVSKMALAAFQTVSKPFSDHWHPDSFSCFSHRPQTTLRRNFRRRAPVEKEKRAASYLRSLQARELGSVGQEAYSARGMYYNVWREDEEVGEGLKEKRTFEAWKSHLWMI